MSDEQQNDNLEDSLAELASILQQYEAEIQSVLAAISADFGAKLELTCFACPVQIEGEIDGLGLYFRSRWDTWRLAIAANLETAIRANRSKDAVFYHESSAGLNGFDASWLESEQVDQAVRACLTAYRAGQSNAGYVELQAAGD